MAHKKEFVRWNVSLDYHRKVSGGVEPVYIHFLILAYRSLMRNTFENSCFHEMYSYIAKPSRL